MDNLIKNRIFSFKNIFALILPNYKFHKFINTKILLYYILYDKFLLGTKQNIILLFINTSILYISINTKQIVSLLNKKIFKKKIIYFHNI